MRHPLTVRTKTLLLVALVVLLTVSAKRLVFDSSSRPVIEFNGQTMGTTYSVKVAAREFTPTEHVEVGALIQQRLDEINNIMSTYDSTSELERFNRGGAGYPISVSSQLMFVLQTALRVSDATGGAFDVTARPLVDAWGFGPKEAPATPLPRHVVDRLTNLVDYRLLELHPLANTVTKMREGVVVDLSAIAKGYGVDMVAEALTSFGLCCFLVEVGGEILARGVRGDGTPWRVGVENPDPNGAPVLKVIELLDNAVATSGDYRNFIEWDGDRYAHIIDARTGWPIPFTGSSVTVVHQSTTLADAWATGLTVLGATDGVLVAEREGIAAHFAWVTADGVKSVASPAFAVLTR